MSKSVITAATLTGLIQALLRVIKPDLVQAETVKVNIAPGYNYALVKDQNGKEIGKIKKSGKYKLLRRTATTATIQWGKLEGIIRVR